MKKVFAIFGFISTAVVLTIAGFFAYGYIFPLKAEAGDLVVFQSKYNGPEATTYAYVVRGEAPDTQIVGELMIPNELRNGEIKGKFFDTNSSTLYFTNDYGFFSYNMKTNQVESIKSGLGGFTFKNIDGKIWYNLDIGFDQEKPENGYINQLCEFNIEENKNQCHYIHNMQIFDIAVKDDNYFLAGYSSDFENFNNMIQSFTVLDNDFEHKQKFTINYDGGWMPELFVDSQNENKIILNNSVVYYSYDMESNIFQNEEPKNYTIGLSSGSKVYNLTGGGSSDYNVQDDCTNIAVNNEALSCKPGRLVIQPFYDSYRANPYGNGMLVRPNTIIIDGAIEEYISIIDLETLTEVKRFNLTEPLSSIKDAVYIME